MLKRGVTFLEILVVISILAVISVMVVPTSQETVTLEKLSSEAKLVAQRMVQLSIDARVSGRVVRLRCTSQGIMADTFLGWQTRDYASANGVANNASNFIETTQVENSTNQITVICPAPQTFYITSEGYVFSAQGVPGISNIELRSGTLAARVDVSGAASTMVRVGVIGAVNNEI